MKSVYGVLIAGMLVFVVGCGASPSADRTDEPTSQYLVDAEPSGAVSVGDANASGEDGQPITLVGLIGGSTEPFVDGLAAFTIVDESVPYCADEEGCPTPWDYCCTQDQVKDNIATVKIVDESGGPLAEDARELLSVKELSKVVVSGTAQKDEQGNLTVVADQVFVKKD
ncbi:hypothetical protein [Rhodopirellula sallentina]|uniref:Signal peptide-domain containing protein n=1 Tax=Rhodopirellula sallentina SM41 TaxID=1263870 RepID=M5TW71_9BACT|nr:hypothetical protein [Rhodopirellula sallentina]EMI53279.1 signal peptide-domain containing protein [Rhodopirellula sallentina SM41]